MTKKPHKYSAPAEASDVEEIILATMLMDNGIIPEVSELLQEEDFYTERHRIYFKQIVHLHDSGRVVDLLTLESRLKQINQFKGEEDSARLSDILISAGSSSNIKYYCQIVKEKSILRDLFRFGTEISALSVNPATDAFDLIDQTEKKAFELSSQTYSRKSSEVSSELVSVIKKIDELRRNPTDITGVVSSLDTDKLTGGWQPGELIIIAARPSMGKTAFMLTCARNALARNESNINGVAIFSLEMSNEALTKRLLTMEARVNALDATRGRLDDIQMKSLYRAAENLSSLKIILDDTPSISISELRSKCRRIKSEHDVGLIVVDYLQLMQAGSDEVYNREQEIAAISRGLKSIAKELNIPVIVLSQLSRAVEQRGGDKRPQLSDLRESGSIEQDADLVIFLYRPEYYGITTTSEGRPTEGLAEAIIAKQRNGPTGTVTVRFIKEYARFENLINE
ncbi:replicative DNA helicase [Rhodohalobacter mucosus]|uniref:Replicative DNA helicase n=1 Tax=Rhodohalobacter mucosus TaxID=2079485 RepID=A0A316TP30_9BACT|nr:replicative DNA helicase [Rhodohalobacter mucosus]PWN06357.1 replicative DNA helicase [Rhodohalobacter mucosus]